MQVALQVLPSIILEHDAADCPFCKSNEMEKPDPIPKSKDVADWEEDPVSDTCLIGNSAGELERNMSEGRPQNWIIDIHDDLKMQKDHKITPNPHHVIPGNESLKNAQELLKWIFADKGKIENDIGYNVNNGENGIWLPSNNSMRGVAWWPGSTNIGWKIIYAEKAMRAGNGQFHDRHNSPYSHFITQILQKIADRMNGIDAPGCPFKPEQKTDGKYPAPYALVSRLNGVSNRIKPYLTNWMIPNRRILTSKLVWAFWDKQGLRWSNIS